MRSEIEIYVTEDEIRNAIRYLTDLLEHPDLPNELIFHDGEGGYGITVHKTTRERSYIHRYGGKTE